MNLVLLLFLIGVVLLAFEVIVPGAVLGIFGGLALVGGVVVAFREFGTNGGLIAAAGAAALATLTLVAEFLLLPRTRFGRKFFLHAAVAAKSQPALAEASDVVGREAETLTPLVPSGYVSVGGKRYEAFSRSGHVPAGTRVRVVGLDNFRLIVALST